MRALLTIAVAATLSALGAHPAHAIAYSVIDIGDLPGGIDYSYALDINNAGQVLGYSSAASGTHAFVWTPNGQGGGSMADIGALPGGDGSYGNSINAHGQAVGAAFTPGGNRSFLWTPNGSGGGQIRDLGTPPGGADFSWAQAINASGTVVGHYSKSGVMHAYVWAQDGAGVGTFLDIGSLPGASGAQAVGINAAGLVLGISRYTFGGTRLFLWTPDGLGGGSIVDLGDDLANSYPGIGRAMNDAGQLLVNKGGHAHVWTPDGLGGGTLRSVDDGPGAGTGSDAYSINSVGQVVGISTDGPEFHPFLWDPVLGMFNLNELVDASADGWNFVNARAINDAGQIVIVAQSLEGIPHALLLTPYEPTAVPSPGSLAALSTGLLLLAVELRKSRRPRIGEELFAAICRGII